MRFVLLNQFYVPDVAPTGQLLHDLARTLVSRGHHVDVICSRGSYRDDKHYPRRDTIEAVVVHRVGAAGFGPGGVTTKLAGSAWYWALATLRAVARVRRPDLILSLTTPPYLSLVGRLVGRLRGALHAHWVMDVYPDVLAAHGVVDVNGVAMRLLRVLGRWQFRGACLVLAPGPFVEERLRQYIASPTRIAWVPLWGSGVAPVPPATVAKMRRDRGWGPEEFILMYSGNMGRGHRFTEFLEASRRLGRRGPRWVFVGEGARSEEVRAFSNAHLDARIETLPYVAPEELAASLSSADVQLVSLSSGWQGLIIPSKLQSSFSVGRPVIFVGPSQNEIAVWIAASGGGWVVDEQDIGGLLAAVEQARDPAERSRRGAAALAFAQESFDRAQNSEQIVRMLERVVAASRQAMTAPPHEADSAHGTKF